MMGDYTVTDDVEQLIQGFPGIVIPLTADTSPTIAEVAVLIAAIEGEVNGVLTSQGYDTIPATTAADVAFLSLHITQKIAVEVWFQEYLEDEMPPKIEAWRNGWSRFLSMLRDGKLRLTGQAPHGGLEIGHFELDIYEEVE